MSQPERGFERRGEILLPEDEAGRMGVACRIAGVLAEEGVRRLDLADPRACRVMTLVARESDLPGEIVRAEPGTVLAAEGVAMLIEAGRVCWAASGAIAERLAGV